jgi:hypothetical protein
MIVDGMAVLRSERGSVARAGQGAGGLQHHRAVNHSAVQPGGSRRGAVSGQHPVRPREGLGVRGQGGVDRLDLGRVDAQLGAEAVSARPRQVGQ